MKAQFSLSLVSRREDLELSGRETIKGRFYSIFIAPSKLYCMHSSDSVSNEKVNEWVNEWIENRRVLSWHESLLNHFNGLLPFILWKETNGTPPPFQSVLIPLQYTCNSFTKYRVLPTSFVRNLWWKHTSMLEWI